MGSTNVSVKGDSDEGHVELTIDGETYDRTLSRENGSAVPIDGNPFLEDSEVADLFAFLLKSNEARQAVERGDDLRELIMRPVDTENIEVEISQLENKRNHLDDQINRLSELSQELPGLEKRRQELQEQIAEAEEQRDDLQEKIETADSDLDVSREEKAELDETLEELGNARSELESVRNRIEDEHQSIDALVTELDELEVELESLPEEPEHKIPEIDDRLDRLRDQKETIDTTVSELGTVIQFNEELLEADATAVTKALGGTESTGGSVTDKLVDSETVVCWTCSNEVDTGEIEDTLSQLRDLRQDHMDERGRLEAEINELKDERASYEEKQRQRDQLERQVERAQTELADRRETVEDLEMERAHLRDRVENLETRAEKLRDETRTELLDLHKEANQVESELGRLRNDLEDVEDEITEIDERLDERDELEERREGIDTELQDLRTRIDRIETEAVEQFNEQMATVLEILEYENLDRIWIERKKQETREGRRKVERSGFHLHVIRSTAEGTVYEDEVTHLSESEREVTGLVFALAGYLTHELHEKIPFLLLDSLEAIDSERIARLVDYVGEYAPYTVIALLTEDAAAVDDSYNQISMT